MTEKEFFNSLNVKLNSQQKKAVLSVDGPFLLLAVPGSGKTTTLVIRLGYMIKVRGISPSSILTVTYTVAAARDIRSRYAQLFGEEEAGKIVVSTINAICAQIIRYYGKLIGKSAFDLAVDDKYLMTLLSALYLKETGDYATESEIKNIGAAITYIKNMQLSKDELAKYEADLGLPITAIYNGYCHELKLKGLMDFDDQMVYAYKILKNDPALLNHYSSIYRYICVDEAQDTSKIQHIIIALLAQQNDNLFMVGDEDQSIYGFRAAYPDALLHFSDRHKNAVILLMEENFRSNANIVSAADRLIKNNKSRHEKSMIASKAASSPIDIIKVKSRSAQYECLISEAGRSGKETAVLFRDNEMGIPLVDMLERKKIPYTIKNGDISFFTNRFVLDLANILMFALNDMRTDLFMQFYYKLNLYLKKETALELEKIAIKKGISVLDAAVYLDSDDRLLRNSAVLKKQFLMAAGQRPEKAIETILEKMGYQEYLKRCGADEGKAEILKSIASGTKTIPEFFQRLEYLRDIYRSGKPKDGCKFILSTIHSSKGLEYDNVYILDVKDGIFPSEAHPITQEERQQLEEERRLFYVAVTRARNDLHIFHNGDSLFLNELMYEKPSLNRKGLCINAEVTHKKYGPGVITFLDEKTVKIRFSDINCEKHFMLEPLLEKGMLQVR